MKRQSPIDIISSDAQYMERLDPLDIISNARSVGQEETLEGEGEAEPEGEEETEKDTEKDTEKNTEGGKEGENEEETEGEPEEGNLKFKRDVAIDGETVKAASHDGKMYLFNNGHTGKG